MTETLKTYLSSLRMWWWCPFISSPIYLASLYLKRGKKKLVSSVLNAWDFSLCIQNLMYRHGRMVCTYNFHLQYAGFHHATGMLACVLCTLSLASRSTTCTRFLPVEPKGVKRVAEGRNSISASSIGNGTCSNAREGGRLGLLPSCRGCCLASTCVGRSRSGCLLDAVLGYVMYVRRHMLRIICLTWENRQSSWLAWRENRHHNPSGGQTRDDRCCQEFHPFQFFFNIAFKIT